MDMNNTWGPLLVGLVFGVSISFGRKLNAIIENLEAIKILLGG